MNPRAKLGMKILFILSVVYLGEILISVRYNTHAWSALKNTFFVMGILAICFSQIPFPKLRESMRNLLHLIYGLFIFPYLLALAAAFFLKGLFG